MILYTGSSSIVLQVRVKYYRPLLLFPPPLHSRQRARHAFGCKYRGYMLCSLQQIPAGTSFCNKQSIYWGSKLRGSPLRVSITSMEPWPATVAGLPLAVWALLHAWDDESLRQQVLQPLLRNIRQALLAIPKILSSLTKALHGSSGGWHASGMSSMAPANSRSSGSSSWADAWGSLMDGSWVDSNQSDPSFTSSSGGLFARRPLLERLSFSFQDLDDDDAGWLSPKVVSRLFGHSVVHKDLQHLAVNAMSYAVIIPYYSADAFRGGITLLLFAGAAMSGVAATAAEGALRRVQWKNKYGYGGIGKRVVGAVHRSFVRRIPMCGASAGIAGLYGYQLGLVIWTLAGRDVARSDRLGTDNYSLEEYEHHYQQGERCIHPHTTVSYRSAIPRAVALLLPFLPDLSHVISYQPSLSRLLGLESGDDANNAGGGPSTTGDGWISNHVGHAAHLGGFLFGIVAAKWAVLSYKAYPGAWTGRRGVGRRVGGNHGRNPRLATAERGRRRTTDAADPP